MNPALLDGAIQAVFCMMQYSPGRFDRRAAGADGIPRLSIHGSVQGTCFVQIVGVGSGAPADDVIADLQIRNERGRPLLRVEGLLLKYVPRDFLDKFDERDPAKPS